MNPPLLLAIETSCDETAAAVMEGGQLLSNVVSSQAIHREYGGIVPELASRAHQDLIVPVVDQALSQAGTNSHELDAVAYTRGPGLLGALMVGASFAKALALSRDVPLLEVHHMRAHTLSHFLEEPRPQFPFLCLTVSGGHTQIVWVRDYLDMEVIGETQDDAVGEAFDKCGKLMELPYPAGPLIDQYAQEGNPQAFSFSSTAMPGYNYSFSGIKTAFLYLLQKELKKDPGFLEKHRKDLCASLQAHLIAMVTEPFFRAAEEQGIEHLAIAGGVAANSGLRQKVKSHCQAKGWAAYIPERGFCTDNAAMIAMAGHYQFLAGELGQQTHSPLPRWGF